MISWKPGLSKLMWKNIFISLFFCVFLSGCSSPENLDQQPQDTNVRVPIQETWNFTLQLTEDELTLAKLKSGNMKKFEGQDNIELSEKLDVDFFNKKGEHTSHLTSDIGIVNEKSKIMKAMGNVVLVSDSGITLYTDELTWNNDNEKIFSDKFCTIITTDNDTVFSYGFESDQSLRNYSLIRPFGVSERKLELK